MSDRTKTLATWAPKWSAERFQKWTQTADRAVVVLLWPVLWAQFEDEIPKPPAAVMYAPNPDLNLEDFAGVLIRLGFAHNYAYKITRVAGTSKKYASTKKNRTPHRRAIDPKWERVVIRSSLPVHAVHIPNGSTLANGRTPRRGSGE